MTFVQIIEFQTSRVDEMKMLGDEWEAGAAASRTARRRVLCQDRDNPGRYFNIVFFDSYESAMENSNNPVTQEFAQKMMALADGAPTFHNLDVVDEREMSH
jgi:quinol monooxygenase YgiN